MGKHLQEGDVELFSASCAVTNTGGLRAGSVNVASVVLANVNEFTVTFTSELDVTQPVLVTASSTAARSCTYTWVDGFSLIVRTHQSNGGDTAAAFSLLVV